MQSKQRLLLQAGVSLRARLPKALPLMATRQLPGRPRTTNIRCPADWTTDGRYPCLRWCADTHQLPLPLTGSRDALLVGGTKGSQYLRGTSSLSSRSRIALSKNRAMYSRHNDALSRDNKGPLRYRNWLLCPEIDSPGFVPWVHIDVSALSRLHLFITFNQPRHTLASQVFNPFTQTPATRNHTPSTTS